MTAIYGRHIIDTLHERVGEEEQLKGRTDIGEDENFNGVWLRGIGHWGHRDGEARGIYDGAPEFDYRFGAMQGGMDFYREEEDGITDHAGMYLAYGHGRMDVTQNLLTTERDAGDSDFNAFSVGGYWTRFGENGWYLDGVVQGTWYDVTTQSNRPTGIGFPDQSIDGFGFGASIEGGYPFDLGDGWQVEPQAQVIWQTIRMDDFNDGAADVRYDNLNSLAGRIGARVARTWEAEEATATEPARLATVWGRVKSLARVHGESSDRGLIGRWFRALLVGLGRDMDRARPRSDQTGVEQHVAVWEHQLQHVLRYRQLRLERQAGAKGQLVGAVPWDYGRRNEAFDEEHVPEISRSISAMMGAQRPSGVRSMLVAYHSVELLRFPFDRTSRPNSRGNEDA
ncbi:autotransporter outer membrane beta-barrel domain-containing protein [Rhizobium leguminosarum bv. viciae]|nr:autotransporter outer membrane beta-barrel domain-containing protein [Rhizobium leguminosarum bv. viciae]